MTTPNIVSLPLNVLSELLLGLDFPDLISLCKTSSTLNSICSSTQFWQLKYFRDFHQPFPPTSESPILVYLQKKIPLKISELHSQFKDQIRNYLLTILDKSDQNKIEKLTTTIYANIFELAPTKYMPDYVQYLFENNCDSLIEVVEQALDNNQIGIVNEVPTIQYLEQQQGFPLPDTKLDDIDNRWYNEMGNITKVFCSMFMDLMRQVKYYQGLRDSYKNDFKYII